MHEITNNMTYETHKLREGLLFNSSKHNEKKIDYNVDINKTHICNNDKLAYLMTNQCPIHWVFHKS